MKELMTSFRQGGVGSSVAAGAGAVGGGLLAGQQRHLDA